MRFITWQTNQNIEILKGPVNKDLVNFALKTSDAFVEGMVCPPYKPQRVCLRLESTGNFKNSDKQLTWPHYLWIKNEIRKNSYKHNQAQRHLIHYVASIVSMLFYFVFGQALSAQYEKGEKDF